MFSNKIALQIAQSANAAGIPPTGMLALVEVETGGQPTEADGRTPNFLFERHIFRRELVARQPDKVREADQQGLTRRQWGKATQYKDERNSSMRLALLTRAKAVDEDCALRSCSWGLPQIMGNECVEVGFSNAKEMVDYLTERGVPGHIELMIRFLKSRRLVSAIASKDWAYVALRYNGKAYKQNQYDTRLAAADRKWQRLLPTLAGADDVSDPPESNLSRDEVEQIQIKLRELNYTEIGMVDGTWGDKTSAGLYSFQKQEGLPPTGHYDAETKAALSIAAPRPVPVARADATINDLRDAGSETVATADSASALGKIKVIGGGTVAAGAITEQVTTALTGAQEKVGQVQGLWGSIHDLLHPFLGHPMVIVLSLVLVASGFLVWHYAGKVIVARLGDHQSGVHAGTMKD